LRGVDRGLVCVRRNARRAIQRDRGVAAGVADIEPARAGGVVAGPDLNGIAQAHDARVATLGDDVDAGDEAVLAELEGLRWRDDDFEACVGCAGADTHVASSGDKRDVVARAVASEVEVEGSADGLDLIRVHQNAAAGAVGDLEGRDGGLGER
jgi:hypothetical protein